MQTLHLIISIIQTLLSLASWLVFFMVYFFFYNSFLYQPVNGWSLSVCIVINTISYYTYAHFLFGTCKTEYKTRATDSFSAWGKQQVTVLLHSVCKLTVTLFHHNKHHLYVAYKPYQLNWLNLVVNRRNTNKAIWENWLRHHRNKVQLVWQRSFLSFNYSSSFHSFTHSVVHSLLHSFEHISCNSFCLDHRYHV